ncbi:hypothetical protein [Tateyamaria omphalii]|uniref:Uncharacterized protein n=1 Tax=Tateyamaria omphalii TaxID=299262 RepID=A0A1P8MRP2_9RHOB|nr:hypothetical protein [Tateyamaria omphalii]APX10694.1 hypothetical protein BWR18_02535 [Tateyamaria omphalii]
MSDQSTNATLFLEKRSYRRRRLKDALRLLPVVGVLLWMLPVFWPSGGGHPADPAPVAMSSAITYVFVVWVLLILAAAALWWVIGERGRAEPDP